MATVPWQDLLDEFRQFRREMAQAHQDHQQRMGLHETQMQAMQVQHAQRLEAHEERMQAMETQTQDIKAILERQDGRLIQAEETLKRITDLWEGRNRPQNGH